VQRAALRALQLFEPATTSQVMAWAHPRKVYRGERLANHDYRSARRVLEQIAVRVGRAPIVGRPILWKLKGERAPIVGRPILWKLIHGRQTGRVETLRPDLSAQPVQDANDGKPWSEIDLFDLRDGLAYGWSIEEATGTSRGPKGSRPPNN
jgi:hypothetical protein